MIRDNELQDAIKSQLATALSRLVANCLSA
jgi:hypothetical protein